MSQLRCTWCMKDVPTSPCPHCGNDMTVVEKHAKHRHEWSRLTAASVECKRCEKVISYEDYLAGRFEPEGT